MTGRWHQVWFDDVVKYVRIRRLLRWLGQILRVHQNRLLSKVIESQLPTPNSQLTSHGQPSQAIGKLLMDAPTNASLDDLITLAQETGQRLLDLTDSLELSIPSHLRISSYTYNTDWYKLNSRMYLLCNPVYSSIYFPQFCVRLVWTT